MPPDYKEGDKLPVVVWAYPREFNNAATAGQVRGSKYRFTRISGYSQLFFLTQGYAVMDRTAMPVVGSDPETVNDTFIEQIVSSAQAAVDETVKRGFGDGERVGVGGHSYGAFMTAHLLAQSDIFKAGIARSGAYNRTLTPFGFQAERRIFWDAEDVYYKTLAVYGRRSDQGADAFDPRYEGQQFRHLPTTVRADVRRAEGDRWNSTSRHVAL